LAIPACSVHVVNQSTGVTNDSTSNGTGFYSVPGLFAGNYTVTFSAPGMKKYQTVVALQDAQVAVLSPKLTVGDVAEQVTVSGDAIQLATYDSGTVSTQLDFNRIDQLPQNGRNVLGLAQNTVPGVEASGTRANGIMQEGMEYSQDGAPMTNRNFGGEANSAQSTLPVPWTEALKAPGSSQEQFDLHVRNFVDCIKSRERPIADVEGGHQVTSACHLANISLRTGRKIRLDSAYLERPYREPWDRVRRSLV
jgi:hypothetical protein